MSRAARATSSGPTGPRPTGSWSTGHESERTP
ncbi:hypothetical protein STRAU_0689 [Streptomyces aurantiacus JA 4570]|uniref:Uncharacterized protein n=1 Tax=Streptomyces aurantiacus JA 4570 TaxID=1286094 RepID=S3ZSV2_9ACTN|nr:hypothetical protein STRAU_0689 [Streptomyces aurantiacus JA 4570]